MKKRALILMSVFFLWATVAIAHLLYYSVMRSSYFESEGRKLFERKGEIPALRGSILDSKKIRLAWNERYYSLYLKPYNGFIGRRRMVFKTLKNIVGLAPYSESDRIECLKENLSPRELIVCVDIIKSFPELEIRSEVRRCYGGGELGSALILNLLKKKLGKVIRKNGAFYGVSGYEKQFEEKLHGESGQFTVMVDRLGAWIPGTWKETKKSVSGQNIILKFSLQELMEQARERR